MSRPSLHTAATEITRHKSIILAYPGTFPISLSGWAVNHRARNLLFSLNFPLFLSSRCTPRRQFQTAASLPIIYGGVIGFHAALLPVDRSSWWCFAHEDNSSANIWVVGGGRYLPLSRCRRYWSAELMICNELSVTHV